MLASFTCMHLAKQIQMLALDVDGVLSNGQLLFDNLGNELKAFDVKDGLGIKLLQRAGIKIAVITGRESKLVTARMQSLGVDMLLQGREDKGSALLEVCAALNIKPEHCAYVGDDWPDLSAFAVAGFKATVHNASQELKLRADYTSAKNGGDGAVREICEFILKAQGKYELALHAYLQSTGVKTW